MHLRGISLLVSITLITACAPTTQSPSITNEMAAKEASLQKEMAIRENMQLTSRLKNVATPILIANAPLCGEAVKPFIGADFATKDSVEKDKKEAMEAVYKLETQPTVTLVSAGSPASGKLQPGDVITQINGKSVSGKEGLETIEEELENNKNLAPVVLALRRGPQSGNITLSPVKACDTPIILGQQDDVNAFSDGTMITVTKGMMRFVNTDTELATVIGHELAHNTRNHIDSKRGNAVVGTVLGAVTSAVIGVNVTDLGSSMGAAVNSQAFEQEADYVGLYHTARAGYPIDDAPMLWRRMASNDSRGIHLAGGSHPSTAKRFLALEATVKEINAKRAAGQPLIPEEKSAQQSEADKTTTAYN